MIRRDADVPAPERGVPLALAVERAGRVSALRYRLHLTIPPRSTEPVRGVVTVRFVLTDSSSALWFDFAAPGDHLLGVVANGQPSTGAPLHQNGHIRIAANALARGGNVVRFDFVASDAPLNRSDDFMYSLFVPARASSVMPCFDQPDLKARWTVSLDIPAEWTAVSNGAEMRRTTTGESVSIEFAETEPLPSYLVAFAVGRFQTETGVRTGRTFRLFHRETDAAKIARNQDIIFDLHAASLSWLEDYTQIGYPFGKFDIVLIPSFQFSGMEHPGAIYYNASTLLLDESATQNQRLGRAGTIAHETAHMWFGNLVTMRWFNDVWMKEVFATCMAARIVNPAFPRVNHELRFLLQNYRAAYDVDRTDGANPIRQDLDNLADAGSLYGAIIYQKAPIVMRQLELIIGVDRFRDGLREYLKTYAMRNASWPDLIAILNPLTPIDLAAWSRAWVDEPGRPSIRVAPAVSNGRLEHLVLDESDPRAHGRFWPEAMTVWLGAAGHADRMDVMLNQPRTEVSAAAGTRAPQWIVAAGAYGLVDSDPSTLECLSTALGEIPDAYVRGNALMQLWEAMLEGRVEPARVIDNLLIAVSREPDELIVQQMLDDIRVAFWRFTPADDRPKVVPSIERVLRSGLDAARTGSLKAAWFAAYRSIALTVEGVGWLERIWRHDERVPGLPIAETHDADLAADLAVRDVADADAILQTQLDRFQDADRTARFAFLLPVLSHDASVRDAFFEGLKDVQHRRREAWVVDAVRYLHHPLRATQSKPLILPALALLPAIQQTGDIFFPKRWADATLSGCQSVQTATEVRTFIARLPADYPPRLRWVLLSAADPLFRAANMMPQ